MKTPVLKFRFNKVTSLQASRPQGQQLYLKETPRQVFSCGYCEIFMSTYFEEHLQRTALK